MTRQVSGGPESVGGPAWTNPGHPALLATMAGMFARLLSPPPELSEWKGAAATIVEAMVDHPAMVEGTATGQCLDTVLMKRLGGRLVAKSGAEGLFTAAIRPNERWPRGLSLAVKIEDGDGKNRARPHVVLELLGQLGLLVVEPGDPLREEALPEAKNKRHERVGYVRPTYRLADPAAGGRPEGASPMQP